MRKISKISIITVWLALIYILFRINLLSGDINDLNEFINNCGTYKIIIFIALSSLRIVALIPSTVFMILGGIIFNPIEGGALTLVSVILSETILYITSKVLVSSDITNYLVNKYPKLYKLLLKNNTKILAIGILCPIAPSDVACFLASSTGLNYRKFILTVIAANIPMIILYSFLGDSVMSSANNVIIITFIILIISIYSIYLWNKEQKNQRLA
ncbi:VTT domain-containing protein [Clostridium sp. A1-XYC3]|uniref:TVP38/TMEM64 family membrane protein n=1 Tax=Clostridium tanneri TaxID=3037988 RepID=A0ABU4JPC7_9CLOT|nr:VTT domain-containing protein [Clostridium sp. A1-XYC3]MDW8799989.1 VTT domain-containing protein [Clostridium sp. A1-XYC3]